MEKCENCDREIGNLETPHVHDGHVVCAECKAKLSENIVKNNPVVVIDIPDRDRSESFGNSCPKCFGNQVVKCSVAYQEGSSTGLIGMVGVDGEGLFGAGGATTGRSMLAAQCAPPPMKEHSLENIMAAVLAIAGAIGVLWGLSWTIGWESNYERRSGPILLIFGIVFGLISIPIFRSIFDCEDWNNTKYPKRLEVWKRKWICKQCGHIYVPTAQSAGGRK